MEETIGRLYNTKIGTTRAMREAVKASYHRITTPNQPVEQIQKQNKEAKVARIPEHGLVIVQYPSGRKADDKQDHILTPRGKKRTPMGGFYSS